MAATAVVVVLVAVISMWLQIIPSQAIKVKLMPRDFPRPSAVPGFSSYLWRLSESDRVQRALERSRRREAAIQSRVQSLRWKAQHCSERSNGSQPLGSPRIIEVQAVLLSYAAAVAVPWLSTFEAPVLAGNGEFLLKISVGTPAIEYEMILDTGSDLIWTQCKPCDNCFQQSAKIFDPTKSSSYKASDCDSGACSWLPEGQSSCSTNSQCSYEYSYGDGSNTTGVIGTDTFKLSGVAMRGIVFGCGNNNYGFDQSEGLVGFGRGNLSLPTQLGQTSNSDSAFAYCLVAASNGSSPMWLGSDATTAFPKSAKVASTALTVNENMGTFYYVTLTQITVGNTEVEITDGAFDIQSDGSGGLIMDSGTTLTYLESQTEQNLIDALKSTINLDTTDGSSVGLDLCYDSSSSNINDFPTVTFTFQGHARMHLTPSNYLIQQDNLLCAAFAAASGEGSVSILGNIAQQDFLILYDTAHNKLSFAKTKCESLS